MDRSKGIISLTICSKDLENGTYYRFPKPLQLTAMRLESAYFPVSFQTITSERNKLRIEQLTGTVPLSGTITIPVGNYDVTELCTTIANLLNGANSTFFWQGTWTCSFDRVTSRVTIANTSTRQFRVVLVDGNINGILGIEPFVLSQGTPQTLAGRYSANLQWLSLINVCSNDLGRMLSDTYHSSYPRQNMIIGTLHVTRGYGQYESVRFHKAGWDYFNMDHNQPTMIDGFDIQLLDPSLKSIDWGGSDWYLEFSFQ